MLGAFLAFLRTATGLPAGFITRMRYPDEQPDQTKTLVIAQVVGTQEGGWLGDRGPFTNPGGGNVDYANQRQYVLRVEVWVASSPQTATPSKTIAQALDQAGLLRQFLFRNKAGLLQNAGLHYVTANRLESLPADPNFPDWHRAAFWFTGWRDEVWTGLP